MFKKLNIGVAVVVLIVSIFSYINGGEAQWPVLICGWVVALTEEIREVM